MLTFTAIIFLPCTILAILPKVLVCCVFILFFRILLISLLTSFSTHGCVFLCGVLGSVSIDRFSPHKVAFFVRKVAQKYASYFISFNKMPDVIIYYFLGTDYFYIPLHFLEIAWDAV